MDPTQYKSAFPVIDHIGCRDCNKLGFLIHRESKKNPFPLCKCAKEHCLCGQKVPYYGIVDDGTQSVMRPCPLYPLHRKIYRIRELYNFSKLPGRFSFVYYKDFDIQHLPSSFIRKIQRIVPAVWEGPEPRLDRGVYFHGTAGSGKTMLAAIIINELIVRHTVAGLYMKTSRSLSMLRETYNTDSTLYGQTAVIASRFQRVPALVIDDLGVHKDTVWTDEILYDLIDYRYEENLFTIVTSNLSLKDLSDKVGERITSRLSEMCHVLKFPDFDYRQKSLPES